MTSWFVATLESSSKVADNVLGMRFRVPGWPGHRAGQHVDVRLTSPDGYVAERSYSIANPPADAESVAGFAGADVVELGVELLDGGEVSPYLWSMKPGQQLELRGPIGGHFIWEPAVPSSDQDGARPLVLVAGGSGMVPLMAMLRHHLAKDAAGEVLLLISARTEGRILYKEELARIEREHPRVRVVRTLTESVPAGWTGYARRIDAKMVGVELGACARKHPSLYVCGPTGFVEAAAKLLLAAGFEREAIRTERFGG